MSRKLFIIACIVCYTFGYGLCWVADFWSQDKSLDKAYERGKIDGQILIRIDSTDLYSRAMVLCPKSEYDTIYVMTALYDKDLMLIDMWGQRITVDPFDSTDTLPAVDRLPIILPDTGGAW